VSEQPIGVVAAVPARGVAVIFIFVTILLRALANVKDEK
jgi:hypothetical protein